MSLAFIGTSHAAHHLREAARLKGFEIVSPEDADLIFVSEDTPTDSRGERNLLVIVRLIEIAFTYDKPVILTSQVPPGFTRALNKPTIFHQPETLRIMDAEYRASNPDYIVVGFGTQDIPAAYRKYLEAFDCPKFYVWWEEAEFSKIAVNMTLASQVDNTNRLSQAAAKCGANWENVARILRHDKRISPESYLTPGRWQDSKHLLRDYVTLQGLEKKAPPGERGKRGGLILPPES